MSLLFKNTDDQFLRIFAFDRTTNAPVENDQDNFLVRFRYNGVGGWQLPSMSPTNDQAGWYDQALATSETNADWLNVRAISTTDNVQLIVQPGEVIAFAPTNWSKGNIAAAGIYESRLANDVIHGNLGASLGFVLQSANFFDVDGKDLQSALQYIGAGAAGNLRDAGSGLEKLDGLDGATQRLLATVDQDGNRTITYQ